MLQLSSSDCFRPPGWREEASASYFNATSVPRVIRLCLARSMFASWTKKRRDGQLRTVGSMGGRGWFCPCERGLQAHKYRNVVVRTDSGTEQSPFRNTCCLAPCCSTPSSSSKSNISYMLFRASFFNRSS